MSARIMGIGVAFPNRVLKQSDAASIAGELMGVEGRRKQALHALYGHSGVEARRTVGMVSGAGLLRDAGTRERVEVYDRHAGGLAQEASRDGLGRAGVDVADVTHLVTVSCTGFRSPGVDIELVRELGLDPAVQRTHVGFMGCHGAINGMRVASAFAEADPSAVVLVCCVEVCSVHFQRKPKQGGATANALFGDGAAACVVSSIGDGVEITGFGSVVIENTADEMGWEIGDHGFEMSLSAKVPTVLNDRVGSWVRGWLSEFGLTAEGVGSWAVHPGGPRIVEAVRKSLGLEATDVQESLEVLREFGNMSSPTVLVIVRRLLERQARAPMLGLAFGPGLTGEAMLLGS